MKKIKNHFGLENYNFPKIFLELVATIAVCPKKSPDISIVCKLLSFSSPFIGTKIDKSKNLQNSVY